MRCSVLFEEEEDEHFVARCLDGFVFAAALSSRLRMGMLQSTFVSSLARFTMLHSPAAMRTKHAQAFRSVGWGNAACKSTGGNSMLG